MSLSIAIVGSGPAGFYAADALIKLDIDCQIDLIERLPTPFGLIRGGVAPDHQSTKRVTKAYERTALQAEPVRYFGNVHLGRDLTLDELREIYDAVVLAVGSPKDRPLRSLAPRSAGSSARRPSSAGTTAIPTSSTWRRT